MSLALDYATLRGALGVLAGRTPQVGESMDLNITALGNLVEAICFQETILVPDLGHQDGSKLVKDAGDAVQHAPLTHDQRTRITEEASGWMDERCNLHELIKLLGIDTDPKIASLTSFHYLLLEAVGTKGKYESEVVKALRSGALDQPPPKVPRDDEAQGREPMESFFVMSPNFIASDLSRVLHFGKGISWSAILNTTVAPMDRNVAARWLVKPELEAFAENLGWSLFRTRCYLVWARDEGYIFQPHPLRARMSGYAAVAEGVSSEEAEPFGRPMDQLLVSRYVRALAGVFDEGRDALEEFGLSSLVQLPAPTVLPYVLQRAGARESVLDAAYELRESRGARSLRNRTASFEAELRSGDMRAALRLRHELAMLTERLRDDLGIRKYPPISATVAVGLTGPSVGVSRPAAAPRGGSKVIDKARRPWLALLRDVFGGLASAAAMGAVRDMLSPDSSEEVRSVRRQADPDDAL